MTHNDHTIALQQFGYSQREASFVALAALHSGYFLTRQFNPQRGQATDRLCRKTMAFKHATSTAYRGGTRLYHLSGKTLYRALGQTDNRHRREQDSFHLRAKVMGLDYVLLNPEYRYLPTEQEKLEFFCRELGIAKDILPTKMYEGERGSKTLRYFVDKYPVRIDPQTNKVAFCYIDDGVFTPPGFRTWLQQYTPLITTLGESEIVYVATSGATFGPAEKEFAKAFPATDGAISSELLAFFEMRRDVETRGPMGRTQDELDTYRRISRRYAARHFQLQFDLWKLAAVAPESPRKVRFSTFVLPFSYAFFGSMLGAK